MNLKNAHIIATTVHEIEQTFPGLQKFHVVIEDGELERKLHSGSMAGNQLGIFSGFNHDKPLNRYGHTGHLDFTMKHELAHFIDQTNPGLRLKMSQRIKDIKDKETFADMVANALGGANADPKFFGARIGKKPTKSEMNYILSVLRSEKRLMEPGKNGDKKPAEPQKPSPVQEPSERGDKKPAEPQKPSPVQEPSERGDKKPSGHDAKIPKGGVKVPIGGKTVHEGIHVIDRERGMKTFRDTPTHESGKTRAAMVIPPKDHYNDTKSHFKNTYGDSNQYSWHKTREEAEEAAHRFAATGEKPQNLGKLPSEKFQYK